MAGLGGAFTVRRKRRAGADFRIHKPVWIDPFPSIPGTEPEKRLFEALVMRRIFFVFQGQVNELREGEFITAQNVLFKPDFILPEYRVILDPFSPFHHTLPGAVERDQQKIATYTALGYTYYYPWAIESGVFLLDLRPLRPNLRHPLKPRTGKLIQRTGGAQDVLSAIPELARPPKEWTMSFGKKRPTLTKRQKKLKHFPGYELGPNLGAGANSVAAANRSRTKPKPITLTRRTRRTRRG